MKKCIYIVMALVMVLGLTQCKKDNDFENAKPELQGEQYTIALNLGGRTSDKADIYPFDGTDIAPVYYTVGDKIQVAYKGVRVGEIICTSSTIPSDPANYNDAVSSFVGKIIIDPAVVDGSPLYFYFIGNKPYGNTSGKLIVDISDQTSQLPVISYAASLEAFDEDRDTYTVPYNWLLNQCALVKFESENPYDMSANTLDNNPNAIYKTTKVVTIFGMDNQVEINLSDNTFTWSQVNGGAMKLYRHSSDVDGSVRYAIVHHKNYTAVTAGELDVPFDPATDPYGFYGTYKIAANVAQNAYYDGAKLDLVWHSGAFTVASGQQVVFSRGNLQYKHYGSATDDGGTWRFAKHQYDFVGGTLALSSWGRIGNVVLMENVTGDLGLSDNELIGNGSYVGWIDLFGWGTGDNPTKHSVLNLNYNDWHEWGAHNVVNSGKPANSSWWSTLSHHEWKYILSQRTDYSSKRGTGTVNGVKGFIILPDNSTATIVSYSNHATWLNNEYTEAQWRNMEAQGAVFLPCAGYRNGDDYDGGTDAQQDHGSYWSSSQSTSAASWGIRFKTTSNYAYLEDDYPMAPDNGHAIRLVHRL